MDQMPKRGDYHWNCQCADEGLVEGEPVLTREGDLLVRAPSAMDSVNIAPWKVSLGVKGVQKVLMRSAAIQRTGNVRERWDPRMILGYGSDS